MASGKTRNYQLSQWSATDQVRMADFNMDNQRVDTALKNLDTAIKSVASAQSAGTKIVFGSYIGTGEFGSNHPTRLDFTASLGRPPKFVLVISQYGNPFLLLFQGMSRVDLNTSELGTEYTNYITWSGNSVSYYCDKGSGGQLNFKEDGNPGVTYYYLAIG